MCCGRKIGDYDKMIRVLQVVGKMHYGGMETLIMNIYRNIDREKVQFDFLVHYKEKGEYDNEIIELGGRIITMPSPIPSNFFLLIKTYKAFFKRNHNYTCVHVHLHNIAFLLFPQAKVYGIRCVLHIHRSRIEHNIKGCLGFIATRLAVPKADNIFACSKDAARYFIIDIKNCEIIKNGIFAEKFYYNADIRKRIRIELEVENKLVLFCAARFTHVKNHEFLIDIIKELKERNIDICALLAGTGPLENQVRQKVNALLLEKEVRFLGARDNIYELMQAADCYIMPSFWEGLGIAYIEAQASGLKTYASKEALVQEAVITDLIEGIPLSDGAKVWTDKILSGRNYIRNNQRAAIEKNGFDIKEVAKKMQEFYQKELREQYK